MSICPADPPFTPTSAPPPPPGTSDVPPPVASCAGGTPLRGGLERRRAVDDLPAAGIVDQERDDVELLRDRRASMTERADAREMACSDEHAGDDGDAQAPGHGVVVVAVVTLWSSWPTVSVTLNGFVLVPSMS